MSDAAPPPGPAHDPAAVTTPALLVLATVAFVTELALFGGVGAIAYAAVGGGAAAWLAGLAATAAVLVLWGLFMAPRGRLRLGPGARTVLALLLCSGTAVGLVLSGWTWWGRFVGLAGLAVVAAQTVLHGPGPERSSSTPANPVE